MAGENDPSNITKNLTPLYRELDTFSKSLRAASENLSNAGLDKFADQLKKTLKASGLYEDSVLDQMKSFKELTSSLETLEKQYNAIKKHEAKAKALAEQQEKKNKKIYASKEEEQKQLKIATDLIKKSLIAKDKELQVTEAQADAIEASYVAIKKEIEQRDKLAKGGEVLIKVHEGLTDSIKKQIEKFASFSTATDLLKKSFWNSYDQLNRLTNKGMLGAFTTVNTLSWQLRLTNEEFEDLINKNRDLVNQMGGGVKGIENFSDELKNVRQSLEYLGKDATKAAARFVEMSKKAGLTPKDGLAYRKNLNESIAQFKRFSGAFGDSYEDYASLMESLNDESSIRTRMNSMSKQDLALYQQEIRTRTENLKWMGLQNNQIVEVNKAMASLVNAEENDIAQRAKEANLANAAYDETIRLLRQSGQFEKAERMERSRGAFQQITGAVMAGRTEEAQRLAESGAGMEALKAQEIGIGATNRDVVSQNDRIARNMLMQGAGGLLKKLRVGGEAAATGEAQGRMTPEAERAQRIADAEKLTAANSALATALSTTTDAVQTINSLLSNPFVQAIGGLIAGIWAAVKMIQLMGGAASIAGKALGAAGGGAGILRGAFGLIKTVAAGFVATLAAMGLDKLFGLAGVGGKQIDEGQDAANWNKMSFGEKLQSGAARGIESIGSFIGLENLSNQARATRIQNETSYLQGQGRAPTAQNKQTAVGSGENPIASVVKAGPGYLIVNRPDGTTERIKGSRNWRNNNPGNLEYNSYTQKLGAIGSDGRFAIFPDYETGRKAKESLIFEGKNYKDLSLTSAISRYAPPSENNTGAYQASVLAAVGGVNKPMSQYTPEERQKILDAMQRVEGFKPGTTTALNAPFTGAPSNGPTPFTGGMITSPAATTAAAPAAVVSSAAPQANAPTEELKKQTELLSQIAKNTSSRVSARPDSYPADQGTVMGATG